MKHQFKLHISEEAWKIMLGDAEKSFPDECCGFFYGTEKDNQRLITEAVAVINNKEGDKRRRFVISPIDYMKAERYALSNELSLLGVYHSHPQHPAIPSEHDLKQALPYFSYIIISVQNGVTDHVRSWRLNESTQQFDEEKLSKQTTLANKKT